MLVRLLGQLPPALLVPPARPGVAPHGPRIGYVLRQYPGFSESFIRRELRAMREAGAHIEVLAQWPAEGRVPDDPAAPVGRVTWFGDEQVTGDRFLRRMAWRRPWTLFRVVVFLVGRGETRRRIWQKDLEVLLQAGRLAAAAEQLGLTHLHAPWADDAAVLCLIASRLLRTRFTVQARASECHRTTEADALPDRVGFADEVITNSRFNEAFLKARLARRTAPPITVIYNGLDSNQFIPVALDPRTHGPARIVAVGRLVEQKGFPVLLGALRMLRDRGLDVACEIIGGLRRDVDVVTPVLLGKQRAEYRLDDCVLFRGELQVPEIVASLHRADLFVLPCVRARDGATDMTPNSLLEGMAMGLPVVSTTHAAIPEIVDDGIDGLLVPPGDAASLAAAMERLLADASLRRRFSEAAPRKVRGRFDARRNVGRRLAVFGLGTAPHHAGTAG